METIQLTEPAHKSSTEMLQAFQWPEEAESTPGSSAQAESATAIQWDALEVISGDRSVPRPVVFTWNDIPSVPDGSVYDLVISTDRSFEATVVFRDLMEPRRSVVNLRIGTRYFWKVIARDGDSEIAVSDVWEFTTHPSAPRWLLVPGMTNVRDIGGWRLSGDRCVRQGVLYRSSEMNGHVDITDEGRQVLIEDLGIRTDIDLRGDSEQPKAVLDPSRVEWMNIPISPYGHIVEDPSREGYRRIFGLFADRSAHPILFHCWGGCDRGGTVAFLLNALLGLDMSSLIRDYELSSLAIWGERSHLSDKFQSLLEALLPFGGKDDVGRQAEGYLRSIGVTAEEIASIRNLLVQPDLPCG
jgi:protein tyrosine/serine phosphatase